MTDSPAPASPTPAPAPEKKEPPKHKPIDWTAAFRYYTEVGEDGRLHSYADVAEKFTIELSHVERKGKEEGWVEKRQSIMDEAQAAWEGERKRAIVSAEKNHLNIWRSVQELSLQEMQLYREELLEFKEWRTMLDKLLNGITDKKKIDEIYKTLPPAPQRPSRTGLKSVVEALEKGVKGERVVLGLPNEVSKADITNTFSTVALTEEELKEADRVAALVFPRIVKPVDNAKPAAK